jgi:hypothetical protein
MKSTGSKGCAYVVLGFAVGIVKAPHSLAAAVLLLTGIIAALLAIAWRKE